MHKRCSESQEWADAMQAEMDSLRDHDVWKLVELPEGRKPVGSKLNVFLNSKRIQMDQLKDVKLILSLKVIRKKKDSITMRLLA